MPNFAFTTTGNPAPVLNPGGSLTTTSSGNRGMPDGVSGNAHIGSIGIVLLAVLGLILLDRGGFRFVVAVGRR